MEFDDDADPWAKQSPENEKKVDLSSPGQTASDAAETTSTPPLDLAELKASTSTSSIVHKDVDEDAWNADSDDNEATEDAFVEATSHMSLSNSLTADSFNAQEDSDEDGFQNTASSATSILPPPVAGPSSIPLSFDAPTASGPPLDDFDDDDGFGDFGEPVHDGNDDDDFGDFDEAGAGTDDNPDFGFSQAQPQVHTLPAPTSVLIPNINFDEIVNDPKALSAAFSEYLEKAIPNLYDILDTSPEAQEAARRRDPSMSPEDIILGSDKKAREMVEQWTDPKTFPYQPWEWKRSRIRIRALREQGIPVNLDDFAPPKKMDPLVLPSIRTTIASPTKGKASTSKQSTGRSRPGSRSVSPAPPGTSAQSTPGSPARRSIQAAIPNIDKDKCELLANITEQEMSLKAIGELEALRNELQASAIEASQHLTALLEKKESLTSQNNTYNAMIQDLVIQAQKLRSSSSPGGSSSRKPSLRRSTSNSKPPSRPASPANTGLKNSVSRSSAAQGSSVGKDPSRRSTLW